jgi:beta-fructofuranosidase
MIDGESVGEPGSRRGKAAVFQRVVLPAGEYRFGAFLRTADGDCWSGSFSLGVAANGTVEYAHDDSTGIAWTGGNLAMRGDPKGDYPEWGEWQWYETDPFVVASQSPVTVWIRFNYVNEHGMKVRWEADDPSIRRVGTARKGSRVLLDGRWRGTSPPRVGPVGHFRVAAKGMPSEEWRSLTVRFREAGDGNGYALKLRRGGAFEMRSPRDGLIEQGHTTVPPEGFWLRLVARGQYLRVDLPGESGFETRVFGSRDGEISFDAEPAGSLDFEVRITTAPPEPPEIPVPVAGEFTRVYDPSVGEGGRWYINDHCVIRDVTGTWHMFGITHGEPANPLDEDFFAHATSPELMQVPWTKQPAVVPVNEEAGQTHVWAPHVVLRDGVYYMFYCGGSPDHDAYRIDLQTSTDLFHWNWYDGNPLFTDIGDARDPMVFGPLDGKYLMYYTRPSDLDGQWSSVAIRESEDLVHWSKPQLALAAHERNRWGRSTESPFIFRYGEGDEAAYYLSATGLGGGYHSTPVWRSLNPRRFDPDHVMTRISAHAPEWISTGGPAPSHVTNCGWGEGGFHIAPVEWEMKPWPRFGLLVIRVNEETGPPVTVSVRRPGSGDADYRTFQFEGNAGSYALPPGKYTVIVQQGMTASDPLRVEVVSDERMEINLK